MYASLISFPVLKVVMNLTLKKKGPSEENFGIKIWNGTIIEFLLLKTVDLNETKRAVTNELPDISKTFISSD